MAAFNSRRTGRERRTGPRRTDYKHYGKWVLGKIRGDDRRHFTDRRDPKNPLSYMEF